MEYAFTLTCLTLLFAGLMAWGIGANDVANAMGTSVGAKALSIKQAVMVAAIFELAGAVLAGSHVTSTVRKGIVAPDAFMGNPETLVFGMLASLLGAAIWLALATSRGWPVSTTHSIVGAIIGFSVVTVGIDAVAWNKVGMIGSSWLISPVVAGGISFLTVQSINIWIMNSETPFRNARRYTPFYLAATFFVISLLLFSKGLKHLDWVNDMSPSSCYLISLGVALLAAALGWLRIYRISPLAGLTQSNERAIVERIFASLMIVTACTMAFAHGSNDVANAIGPAAAVLSTLKDGTVGANNPVSPWVLMLGGVGIVVGLLTYGRRVMETVGQRITQITPYQGFSAEIGASSTVVFASTYGMPISTSHALVGAVLGVGLAKGLTNIDAKVVSSIFLSWLITIPAGAVFCVLIYFALRLIFP